MVSVRHQPPRLSRATTAELVAALESPHGWWRDTAHRLLFERQDQAAVAPLEALATQSPSPAARVNALWSLQGMEALSDRVIAAGLTDSHAGVRENASPACRAATGSIRRTALERSSG
jgi:hypothetical protein